MLLHDLLNHACKLHPQKIALIDGENQYSYQETFERIKKLAQGFLNLGLKSGDHIAILANNSHRYFEAFFASSWAGMPLAPLNTRLSAEELAFILNDGEIKALLLGPEYFSLYEQFKSKTPNLKQIILLDSSNYEVLVSSHPPLTKPVKDWNENDMINLCYTGGTTGLPKGVMLSHRNLISNAMHMTMTYQFTEKDRWLYAAPMFHAAGNAPVIFMAMAAGTHIFIPAFSPEATLSAFEKYRITKTVLIPTMINAIIHHPKVKEYDLDSLDLLLCGGSAVSHALVLASKEILGPKFCQVYGMTETSPLLTAMTHNDMKYEGNEKEKRQLTSCGQPIVGVKVRIVNAETNEDIKPGEVGELIAQGPNVMLGYWNRPKETAEVLRNGYIHTGDVATVDEENFIYIVDRSKDMIISGGENIFSTEVENTIYKHPAVLETAVIGIPDEQWGELVLAIIVLKEEKQLTEKEIIDHCHQLIAGYKCPKKVIFQTTPLPKSGPGKILKTELRKPYWEKESKQVN